MFGAAAPYFVAISAITFAGLAALTIIYSVNHWEPEAPDQASQRDQRLAA